MTDTPLEETWSPEPVKAWRYFWVGPLTWNWTEDRWEVILGGDVEEWTGPVKYAGHHEDVTYPDYEPFEHDSPHTGCMCGVNAVKTLTLHEIRHRVGWGCSCTSSRLKPDSELRTVALTPVELAGIVDEYELGYRAQQATIVGPIVLIGANPKTAQVLAQNYGVKVTTDYYPLLHQLELDEFRAEKENERGHRKADTSDHRGAGTSQSPGAGEGTRKGWRKVADGAIAVGQFVGFVLALWATIAALIFGIYSLSEWISGSDNDGKCLALSEATGGSTIEVGTFWSCRVVLPSGFEIPGGAIYQPTE